VAIIASFVYLQAEISKNVKEKRKVSRRSRSILFLGLVESLTMGLVFCDLFGAQLVKSSSDKILQGFFGLIYPKVVLLYFPLALFIGIFVQIFWEEKPITHPL